MTKVQTLLLAGLVPGFLAAQPLDPALLTKPLGESWPTYSGDYSSKRYSSLKQINQSNVKNLTLAWASRVTAGAGDAGGRRTAEVDLAEAALPPSSAAKAQRMRRRRRGQHPGIGARHQRSALLLHSRQRLGHGCARWPRAVALLLEDQRRHPHRQSRSRHVGQLALPGDAGRLPGLPRRRHRQGALAQGNRQLQPAVFLHHVASRDRQPRHHRHRQRSR